MRAVAALLGLMALPFWFVALNLLSLEALNVVRGQETEYSAAISGAFLLLPALLLSVLALLAWSRRTR